jgi:hypothetical protein
LIAHKIYEKRERDEYYRKMREEEKTTRDKQEGNEFVKQMREKSAEEYGKKFTCRIS